MPLPVAVGFNKLESLCERTFVAAKAVWEGSEYAILRIVKTQNRDVTTQTRNLVA